MPQWRVARSGRTVSGSFDTLSEANQAKQNLEPEDREQTTIEFFDEESKEWCDYIEETDRASEQHYDA